MRHNLPAFRNNLEIQTLPTDTFPDRIASGDDYLGILHKIQVSGKGTDAAPWQIDGQYVRATNMGRHADFKDLLRLHGMPTREPIGGSVFINGRARPIDCHIDEASPHGSLVRLYLLMGGAEQPRMTNWGRYTSLRSALVLAAAQTVIRAAGADPATVSFEGKTLAYQMPPFPDEQVIQGRGYDELAAHMQNLPAPFISNPLRTVI